MEKPENVDCPKCGKENEYSMGSCRNCGEPRPETNQDDISKSSVLSLPA